MLDKLKQDLENANLAYDEFKKTHSTPTTISDKLAEFGFGTDVEIREMKLTQSELEEMKSLETRVKNAHKAYVEAYLDSVRVFPKLLIIGHMRHGKDTLAEILNEQVGLKFISSSQAAADIFIYDELKEKYGYKTSVECFEDRVNHRAEWYEMICDYNKDDRAKLAKGILKMADCYVGMLESRVVRFDYLGRCLQKIAIRKFRLFQY